jgi:hypothetical protein
VDLELVCSSPPEFKGKPWNIYEHSGCDNDNTDVADPVDGTDSINHTSTHERVAKYRYQLVTHSPSRLEQVKLVKTGKCYFYTSIALFVLFLCLLSVSYFMWWCGVRPRTLRRSGRVKSHPEIQPLSISNI